MKWRDFRTESPSGLNCTNGTYLRIIPWIGLWIACASGPEWIQIRISCYRVWITGTDPITVTRNQTHIIHINTLLHTHMCTCTLHTRVHRNTYVYTHTHTYTSIHVHTPLYMHIYTYIQTNNHAYIHIYTLIYTHTSIHTYIYICAYTFWIKTHTHAHIHA